MMGLVAPSGLFGRTDPIIHLNPFYVVYQGTNP